MKQLSHLFFSAFFLFFSKTVLSQGFDISLLKPINKNETAFKHNYLELSAAAATSIGIGIPAAIAITGFIRHDKKLQQDALYMGGVFITSTVISQSLKYITKRQRPFEKYSFIIKRDDAGRGLSFPSRHTSSAFATATSVALRYRKWYFVIPSYVFAGSVAWARMYQGVHYPSDVFVGAIVGTGSAWLAYKIQKGLIFKTRFAPSPNPKF